MIAWRYTLQHIFSIKSLFLVAIIGFCYVELSILLLNYHFILTTFFGPYDGTYKIAIIRTLILGSWYELPSFEFSLLVVNALLVGLNILLGIKTIYELKHTGSVRLSVGGASLVGIITTGCSSCGFSVLSLLGLSASLSFLPFHGLELHIAAVVLLFFSFLYMLFQLHKGEYCALSKKE